MARDIRSLLRQQAALATFGSYAFNETDLSKILNEAARVCALSLDARYCKICRYRPIENDLLIVAGYGWQADIIGKVMSQASESSPQGRAFITRQPVIVRNLTEENVYEPPPFYAQHGVIATVDVIIRAQNGTTFGVMEVDSDRPFSYDEHDINFLTGFANVLAEAVATRDRNQVLYETLATMQALVVEKDRLLEERNVLATELQHRVRNNLQLINDMLNAQLREPAGHTEQGIRGIIRRVMTLAQVYDHLLGTGMSGCLDFGAYAKLLCQNLPSLQPARALPITLTCRSEKMILNVATVTALGLIIAELVANSYEHAFPNQTGTIEITVKRSAAQQGIVIVKDDGIGYEAPVETRRLGIGLVRRLVQQVRGNLERLNIGGTTWTVSFPVE